MGAQMRVMERDWDHLAKADGAHFDFVHNGGLARRQVLNTGAAYLPDFYYCDPKGLYFESSINDMEFDLSSVNPGVSDAFLQRLRADYVAPRRSRYDQPRDIADFGAGHIAVFLQDYSQPLAQARYMDAPKMLQAVLNAPFGRRVVVKPHPRNIGPETRGILAALGRMGRPDVVVTQANLHDILRGAAVSVSISSSAALEGMLHAVPAVLFGRSDLHSCATVVQAPEDWPAAYAAALSRDWPFAAFLHWFLRRQSIDVKSAFLTKVIARMQDNGADLGALGLKSADLA